MKKLIIITALFLTACSPSTRTEVRNFKDCIAAGNPVMESFPRQCRHGGETFTEIVKKPTSADNAPPGSIHNLPVPDAVAAVRTHVANQLGLSEGVVIILSASKRDWPNSCLGLESPDEMCLQVITPGFHVKVQADGKEFMYRTNMDGRVLRGG